MVPIIDPEDDYLTIAAAEERMALTHDARQKELNEAHARLRRECVSFRLNCKSSARANIPSGPSSLRVFLLNMNLQVLLITSCAILMPLAELAKTLEAARVSATRPSTIPSAEEHVAHMNDLVECGLDPVNGSLTELLGQ